MSEVAPNEDDVIFQAWECISLYTLYGTTFDLVIRDPTAMMALLHFLHRHVYSSEGRGVPLHIYNSLKIKMKVSFIAW